MKLQDRNFRIDDRELVKMFMNIAEKKLINTEAVGLRVNVLLINVVIIKEIKVFDEALALTAL